MSNNTEPDECLYCGNPEADTWHQPYSFEPGAWVCAGCMEEQPWK